MNSFANAGSQSPQSRPQHRHRRSMNGSVGGGDRAQLGANGHQSTPTTAQRAIPRNMGGDARADMLGAARSPPKNKNTSHVPCKFYLQGQCQAGRMCPFSHDIESTTRPAPCKYFAKGHCKFGAKCALLHITPDGVVVNRRTYGPPPPFPNNAPLLPGGFAPPPPGLLSIQAHGLEQRQGADHQPPDFTNQQRNGTDGPQFDYSPASPQYGSPPHNRGMATSPPHQKGLSVLDAPLPNSFDSNGISLAARNGPFAASVPSRFGLESPPASLPRNAYLANNALQGLHHSAFGDSALHNGFQNGTSPPSGDEPLTFPKRPLHSDRFDSSRTFFSASVGTKLPSQSFEYSDDEPDTDQEENLLPASLRDLIPDGRSRRGSRTYKDDDTPASFLAAQRRTLSSNTTPQESKVGSPSFSSSPSRYSGMFAQRSMSSDFVGSPLRNSGFTDVGQIGRSLSNTDLAPAVNSPPRQASMSMLTQELQRTKVDAARTQVGAPVLPNGSIWGGSPNGSNGRKSLDRDLSSTSIGRERIDEEQELFDMDEISGPTKLASRPQSSDSRAGDVSISSRLFSQVAKNGANHGAIGSQRVK